MRDRSRRLGAQKKARHFLLFSCLALWVGFLPESNAQEDTRLMLNVGGPISEVQCVRFSPDGNRLYSAGADKVVRVWDLDRRGDNDIPRASLSKTFYWQIARSRRGHIYSLDVSPDGKLIAFAGVSATKFSDIWVVETDTGLVRRVLNEHKDKEPIPRLCFSKDGSWLASVSYSGEVLAWNTETWKSISVQSVTKARAPFWGAAFIDEKRLAFPVPVEKRKDGLWKYRIDLFDCNSRQRFRTNAPLHHGFVYSIASKNKEGVWASADFLGNVHSYSQTSYREIIRKGEVARQLRFDGNGNLLILNLHYPGVQVSSIEKWQTNPKKLIAKIESPDSQELWSIDVSPDGKLMAAAAQQPNSVVLGTFPVGFEESRLTTLSGAATTMRRVRFVEGENYRLELADDGKDVEGRSFDLAKLQWANESKTGGQSTPIDGWEIEDPSQTKTPLTVKVMQSGQDWCSVDVSPGRQGVPTAYCLLTGGKKVPWGIAIGTNQFGIFIYSLPERRNGEAKLLRYFRDHVGEVTSLSESHDGKYLSSSSTDGTAKIWSLDGLLDDSESLTWKMWGSEFVTKEGVITIKRVHPAGIISSRGLAVGDQIISLETSIDLKSNQDFDSPQEMLALLKSTDRMWLDTTFAVLKKGETNIRAGWEPIVSLLVTNENHWAVWCPQGYYASSEIGDEYFGWLTNLGRDVRPVFQKASSLREEFENADVIKRLLQTGDLEQSLENSGVDRKSISEFAKRVPRIRIRHPQDGAVINASATELKVDVEFAQAEHLDVDVHAYINGIPLPDPTEEVLSDRIRCHWDAELLDQLNRIVIKVATNKRRDQSSIAEAVTVLRTNSSFVTRRKIHLFALSAEEYAGRDLKLDFPHEDALALEEMLRDNAGKVYEAGVLRRIKLDAGRDDYRGFLDQEFKRFEKDIKGELGGEDILFVFVAAHGYHDTKGPLNTKEFFVIPPHASLNGFSSFGKLREIGIPWQIFLNFFEDPNRFGCRRVYLLDTCHSGSVKHYFRPVRSLVSSQALIISGCESDGQSYEAKELGHGLFTFSFLRGVKGKADGMGDYSDKDGNITLDETRNFLIKDVSQLARFYGDKEKRVIKQVPVAYGEKDLWLITLSRLSAVASERKKP